MTKDIWPWKDDPPDPGMKRTPRPKDYRPKIPPKVQFDVLIRQEGKCACGCGEKLGSMDNVQFDHDPALVNRDWDEWNADTIPPANDPAYLFAKTIAHHQTKTKKDIKTRDKTRRLKADTAEFQAKMEAKAGRGPQEPEKPFVYASGSGSRGAFAPDPVDELDELPGGAKLAKPEASAAKSKLAPHGKLTRSSWPQGRKMATSKDSPLIKGVNGKLRPRLTRINKSERNSAE